MNFEELTECILNDDLKMFKSNTKKKDYEKIFRYHVYNFLRAPKIKCLKEISKHYDISTYKDSDGVFTLLSYAAQHLDSTIINFLIEKNFDVNVINEHGSTILHDYFSGYYNDNSSLVENILSHDFDVTRKDENGNTVLHIFAQNFSRKSEESYEHIFNLLVNAGCNMFAENNEGDTPLISIARMYDDEGGTVEELKFFDRLVRNHLKKKI